MAVKVALAGATGNLGPAILNALLEAGFEVTVLTRKDSNAANSLPKHPHLTIVNIDYQDVDSLTSALRGIEVVVSALPILSFEWQKYLIDAALAAGVKRFIPGEFGVDMRKAINRKMPVFESKLKSAEHLESLAQSNPSFTYTYIYTNLFLDWGIAVGFILNVKEHTASLYDGGDVRISLTSLPTIAKAVVAIINNLDVTRNRAVCIHDGIFTQNQLIGIFKEIDGQAWTTEVVATKECETRAYEALSKNENVMGAMYDLVRRSAFSEDHFPNFSDRLDNELLGLKELSQDELRELLTKLVST